MPDLVFFAVCIVGAFILAMRRAPLWAWAVGLAAAAYVWQSGMLYGEASGPCASVCASDTACGAD